MRHRSPPASLLLAQPSASAPHPGISIPRRSTVWGGPWSDVDPSPINMAILSRHPFPSRLNDHPLGTLVMAYRYSTGTVLAAPYRPATIRGRGTPSSVPDDPCEFPWMDYFCFDRLFRPMTIKHVGAQYIACRIDHREQKSHRSSSRNTGSSTTDDEVLWQRRSGMQSASLALDARYMMEISYRTDCRVQDLYTYDSYDTVVRSWSQQRRSCHPSTVTMPAISPSFTYYRQAGG